jgi:hypothetical protein
MHLHVVSENVVTIPLKGIVHIVERVPKHKPVFRVLQIMELVKEQPVFSGWSRNKVKLKLEGSFVIADGVYPHTLCGDIDLKQQVSLGHFSARVTINRLQPNLQISKVRPNGLRVYNLQIDALSYLLEPVLLIKLAEQGLGPINLIKSDIVTLDLGEHTLRIHEGEIKTYWHH